MSITKKKGGFFLNRKVNTHGTEGEAEQGENIGAGEQSAVHLGEEASNDTDNRTEAEAEGDEGGESKHGEQGDGGMLKLQPIDIEAMSKAERDLYNATGYVQVGGVYVKKTDLDTLYANVQNGGSTLLIGETGTGKTSLVQALADLTGKNLTRVSVNGSTGVEEIIGKYTAKEGSTIWQDGVLIRAMREGEWIILDEINSALPEILFALHQLLDHDRRITLSERDGELVRPQAGFRFFANMNPPEEYAGTKDLNKALLSRFDAVITVDVLPAILEVMAVRAQTNIEAGQAKTLVNLAGDLRVLKERDKIFYFCSTRDLIQAGKLITAGLPMGEAIRATIANKMNRDDLNESAEAIKNRTGQSAGRMTSIATIAKYRERIMQLEEENKQLKEAKEGAPVI